jgi:hypothetical protein
MTTEQSVMAPTAQPPGVEQTGQGARVSAAGTSAPKAITDEQLHALVQETIKAMAPTLIPPAVEVGFTVEGVTAATWQTGKTVTALWGVNETRNAWMHVDGLGWRKLYNGRDGAFVALTMLASQARQTGKPISFRQEADGMVYEIYLW